MAFKVGRGGIGSRSFNFTLKKKKLGMGGSFSSRSYFSFLIFKIVN